MQTFCAVLLGQPEEIALCALSTHFRLSAASLHLGIYTLSYHMMHMHEPSYL